MTNKNVATPNTNYQPPTTIFIVGPTASGKSALAIEVAKKFNGEIICADSRTIYRGLDISTAKPSIKEQDGISHWGLDLIDPNQRYSASDFKNYAKDKIIDIQSRGKLPIIVGGTGLYIDGLLFDFNFGPAANEQLREKLELLDIEELQKIIVDKNIEMPHNAKNKRYLIRAIEQGGVNKQKNELMEDSTIIGLNPGMKTLEQRIKNRSHEMLKYGAIQETENLFNQYGYDSPAAGAPFFKAFAPHFIGGKSIEECLERLILNDRQLAKRQIAWFKRNKHIKWFSSPSEAKDFIHSILL